jgi:hypothetical protein
MESYPPRPLSPVVMPSYLHYHWRHLPYDTSLADALKEHLLPPPETLQDKLLLDIFNESAEKNKNSTAKWKPGTLDVLALAQTGLENVYKSNLSDTIENTVRALSNMTDQVQAQEFTRGFVPLLFNWVQSTKRKGLSDPDYTKDKSLFDYFCEINQLQGDNAIGIQHAFYRALSPEVYKAFDLALPATNVRSFMDELQEIGDKLLNSDELKQDPSFDRETITNLQEQVKKHYDDSGIRHTQDRVREEAMKQGTPTSQESTNPIDPLAQRTLISLSSPQKLITDGVDHIDTTSQAQHTPASSEENLLEPHVSDTAQMGDTISPDATAQQEHQNNNNIVPQVVPKKTVLDPLKTPDEDARTDHVPTSSVSGIVIQQKTQPQVFVPDLSLFDFNVLVWPEKDDAPIPLKDVQDAASTHQQPASSINTGVQAGAEKTRSDTASNHTGTGDKNLLPL